MSGINGQADAAFWEFTNQARSAMQDVTKMVLIEIGERLIYRSPYGQPATWKRQPAYIKGYIPGHFINNWQLGVDIVPTSELPGVDSPAGENTRRRIRQSIPRWTLGHTYYFANNVAYASALENGHSRQAPMGIIGLTEMEFQQIVTECEGRYAYGERPGLKKDS